MSDQLEKQNALAEEALRRAGSYNPEQAAEASRAGAFDSHLVARDDNAAEEAYQTHGPNRSRDAEESQGIEEQKANQPGATSESTPGEAVLSWGGGDPVSHPSSPTSEPRSAAAERTAGVSGTEIPPSAAEPKPLSAEDLQRRQQERDRRAYADRVAQVSGNYPFAQPMMHSQATDSPLELAGSGPIPLVPVASNFSEGHLSGVENIVASAHDRGGKK